jgi:DNA invertase Pin-like site-specific DNA recombinase
MNAPEKVQASHLKRDAYLYVRQSSLQQVFKNQESTERQYALRQRAVALGWPLERIVVIDSDLGQSGASSEDREGFQRLVAEVGMGQAGIVLGLEVSRLARNSSDWHRLLEICALSDTLILDEDGLYDPSHFNDRLLLGLKGTMSEAELHVLRARLQGGLANKARRGELKLPLPVGLVYDARDRVVRDPDQQVQGSLRTFFQTFERTGSASATVKSFQQAGLLFPRRLRRGVRKGELVWGPLEHSRALQTLHNPRYSGTYVWGRYRVAKNPRRKTPRHLPPDQWGVVLPETHAGYISWAQYQRNLQRLQENARRHGQERRRSPPGEGPALLQGLVVCGVCGRRMTLRYHTRDGRLTPTYVCQSAGIEHAQPICQSIPGHVVDEAISQLVLRAMKPVTLEVTLAVQQELEQRLEEANRLRQQRVARARYEADLAQQRFMQVDPKNRLVADALEAEWNARLRDLSEAQDQYEQQSQADRVLLDEQSRQRIRALATDFPRLWNDPRTPSRERKRMMRLLIEDVTLSKDGAIIAHVRFKGGACQTLTLARPLPAWEARMTDGEVVAQIDQLLNNHTIGQIAPLLNQQGLRSGAGLPFTAKIVARLCRAYQLKSRHDRLREVGKLTLVEIAEQLRVSTATVKVWRRHGLLRGHPYNDKNECLYDPSDQAAPSKSQGRKLSQRRRFPRVLSHRSNEVQHAI